MKTRFSYFDEIFSTTFFEVRTMPSIGQRESRVLHGLFHSSRYASWTALGEALFSIRSFSARLCPPGESNRAVEEHQHDIQILALFDSLKGFSDSETYSGPALFLTSKKLVQSYHVFDGHRPFPYYGPLSRYMLQRRAGTPHDAAFEYTIRTSQNLRTTWALYLRHETQALDPLMEKQLRLAWRGIVDEVERGSGYLFTPIDYEIWEYFRDDVCPESFSDSGPDGTKVMECLGNYWLHDVRSRCMYCQSEHRLLGQA